jgi:hypothetical protein
MEPITLSWVLANFAIGVASSLFATWIITRFL